MDMSSSLLVCVHGWVRCACCCPFVTPKQHRLRLVLFRGDAGSQGSEGVISTQFFADHSSIVETTRVSEGRGRRSGAREKGTPSLKSRRQSACQRACFISLLLAHPSGRLSGWHSRERKLFLCLSPASAPASASDRQRLLALSDNMRCTF